MATTLLRIQGWSETPLEIPPGGDVLTVQHPPSGRFFSLAVTADRLADPAQLEESWQALIRDVFSLVDEDAPTPAPAPPEPKMKTRNLAGRVKGRRELLTPQRLAVLTDATMGVLVEDTAGNVWRDEALACGHYVWPGRCQPTRTKVTSLVRELERIGWLVPKQDEPGAPIRYVASVLAGEALAGSVR